jgi:D-threo-aldose 1-dehydrogenase
MIPVLRTHDANREEMACVTAAERRRLGSTAVDVTPLALGCAPLAGLFTAVGDGQAEATVEAAWRAGIRTFDTAPHYGAGLSERRLGRALRSYPRADVVVCTKVGRRLISRRDTAPAPAPVGMFAESCGFDERFDFSRDGVLRTLEASLERLGLERVDVVHVHDPDAREHLSQAIAETVPALAALRDEGAIGAVGAGMNDAAALARLVRDADLDCVLVAGRHTLLDQSAADELLPLCERRGVGVLAAGVFNSGILADPTDDARYDYAPAPPALLAKARRIAAVCARHGVSLPAAALAFARRHPAVASVVVGARSPAEVDAAARAFAAPVPDAVWADLVREGLLGERHLSPQP